VHLGAATITDLSWKQELDLYACTECGRCQNACPAWNTGKPLSPKLLVMDLRDHLFEQGPKISLHLPALHWPTASSVSAQRCWRTAMSWMRSIAGYAL
jgi:Fe-S oxidoreductase